ncbi:MAG: PhoH family protein [Verrucomicrobiota bacterium]
MNAREEPLGNQESAAKSLATRHRIATFPETMPDDASLQFESAHFLQSLFAHDFSLLKKLEAELQVRVTTRDNWIKFDGEERGIHGAIELFEELEKARRDGAEISAHTFRVALDMHGDDVAKPGLKELLDYRLLGSKTRPAVTPKSVGQLEYLRAMDQNDVVFGIGPAGTGKTYLAMAKAIASLKAKEVKRIILTRPAVEAGEALGFLPGDLEEKILPYLRPLYDALYDMLEPDEVQRMIEKGMIEIAPLAYMRGRTLNHAAIVLDEAQNTTCEQMFMFLTRLGTESRCAITGDPSQVDLKHHVRSGLWEALEVLQGIERIGFVRFAKGDVVRHPVVQSIISAYDNYREQPAERDSK